MLVLSRAVTLNGTVWRFSVRRCAVTTTSCTPEVLLSSAANAVEPTAVPRSAAARPPYELTPTDFMLYFPDELMRHHSASRECHRPAKPSNIFDMATKVDSLSTARHSAAHAAGN